MPGPSLIFPARSPVTTLWSLRSRTKEANSNTKTDYILVEKTQGGLIFSRIHSRTRSRNKST
uniref:Uncharacterized protein n=1 Tax=Physcomitrium patens TaxID=3218 RepID=A0A2K1K8I9_PHYPA|nr:hypothetical protein PHYPA_011992 [Physcomitrium patens]